MALSLETVCGLLYVYKRTIETRFPWLNHHMYLALSSVLSIGSVNPGKHHDMNEKLLIGCKA